MSTTDPPLHVHPGWEERFPRVVQGVTGRGEGRPRDMALFGEEGGGAPVHRRWHALARRIGGEVWVHGEQVHGSRVALHRPGGSGIRLVPACDGHLSAAPGVVLTVSLADCVPVFLLDPTTPAVGLLHAGWRGAAAGIVERGIGALADRLGSAPRDLHVYLGPAICGECYEVGPEVHRALGLEEPPVPEPVDLRGVLGRRAEEAGVRPERVERSELCTRCGPGIFFSHRAGDRGRQIAFLGLRREGR